MAERERDLIEVRMETEEDDQDYSPASSVSEDAIDGLESEDFDSQDDADGGGERGPVDEDGNDNEGNGSDAGELSDPERERERERAGMPRHVQRALWRILVGDPARLGPEPSTHDELIDSLKRARILLDQRVSRAMELIPRGSFVPQEQQGEAYLDCPLAVPQLGFNISAPHIHATCLERLELEPGHHFLDVGSGCGLVTCLGAYIVGKSGISLGVEINDDAIAVARANLTAMKRAIPEFDLTACHPNFEKHNVFLPDPLGRTYDRINVAGTCPASRVGALLALLKPQGKLIVPCGSELRLYTKRTSASGALAPTPGGTNGVLRGEIEKNFGMEIVSNVRFGSLVVPTDAEVVVRTLELEKQRELTRLRAAEESSAGPSTRGTRSRDPQPEARGMDDDPMESMAEEEEVVIDPNRLDYDCLIVGQRIPHGIPMHKRLLTSKCVLFQAQAVSGMRDAHSNQFEIPDNFSFQACILFVDFLYGRGAFVGLKTDPNFLRTKKEVRSDTRIGTLELGQAEWAQRLCVFFADSD